MLRAQINENNEVVKWPVWDHQIQDMFPQVSFPDPMPEDMDLTHLGLINVPPTIGPETPEGMKPKLGPLVWENDQWNRTYEFVPIDPPEDLPAE